MLGRWHDADYTNGISTEARPNMRDAATRDIVLTLGWHGDVSALYDTRPGGVIGMGNYKLAIWPVGTNPDRDAPAVTVKPYCYMGAAYIVCGDPEGPAHLAPNFGTAVDLARGFARHHSYLNEMTDCGDAAD